MGRRVQAGEIDSARINRHAFSYFRRLQRVERFVQEHYAEEISRTTVAQVAALDESYFSTFFHEQTGVRFCEWLALVRVTRAMALMRRANYPISVVAARTGFQSLRTFERSFKRWTGMTPRSYRRAARRT